MITQDSPGTCSHCFADFSIHEAATLRCPKNGREEYREGYKQVWMNTVFENYKWRQIADQGPDMLAVLQQCLALTVDLNAGHFIKPQGGANQDIIQRIKAMQPRIYNLIKPLQ